jgi:hypothetical protein
MTGFYNIKPFVPCFISIARQSMIEERSDGRFLGIVREEVIRDEAD